MEKQPSTEVQAVAAPGNDQSEEQDDASRRYRLEVFTAEEVRFTQQSIGSHFSNGTVLEEAVSALNDGRETSDAEWLHLEAVKVADEQIFSLDNRRLWVLKEHSTHQLERGLGPVLVFCKIVGHFKDQKAMKKAFSHCTTENEGVSVEVRRGRRF